MNKQKSDRAAQIIFAVSILLNLLVLVLVGLNFDRVTFVATNVKAIDAARYYFQNVDKATDATNKEFKENAVKNIATGFSVPEVEATASTE